MICLHCEDKNGRYPTRAYPTPKQIKQTANKPKVKGPEHRPIISKMSLADLKVGGLYVILQARQEPPEPNEFYWGLYLHSDAGGGMAYHVVDTGSGLRPEHEYTGGIFNTPLLTGLFRIADITRPLHPFVDRVIRSYDSSLNCPGRSSNSKFWVLNVLALLIQPTATGWLPVNCHNLPILEQEIRDWGNRMSQGRCIYQRPKPIGSSTICGLPEWKTQRELSIYISQEI